MAFSRSVQFRPTHVGSQAYNQDDYVMEWQNMGGGYMLRQFPNVLTASRIEFTCNFRMRVKFAGVNPGMPVQNLAYEFRCLNNSYPMGGHAMFDRQSTGPSIMLYYYSDYMSDPGTPGSGGGEGGESGSPPTYSYDPSGWRFRIMMKENIGGPEGGGGGASYYTLSSATSLANPNGLRNTAEPRAPGYASNQLLADNVFTMHDPQSNGYGSGHGSNLKTMKIVMTRTSSGTYDITATISGPGVNTGSASSSGSASATAYGVSPHGDWFGFIGNGTRQHWATQIFFVDNIRLVAT